MDWLRQTALWADSTNIYGTTEQQTTVSKIKVYEAVVLSTLLHGVKSLVTYFHHLCLPKCFHQCCLCTILKIFWSDFITNPQVLDIVNVTSIEARLLEIQLCWAGHVLRMEDHHLPKSLLYGELSTGYCKRGAPWKRFKDCLKKTLTSCSIDQQYTRQPPSLKMTIGLALRRRGKDRRRVLHRHPTLGRLLCITNATESACPISALSAISVPATDMEPIRNLRIRGKGHSCSYILLLTLHLVFLLSYFQWIFVLPIWWHHYEFPYIKNH